MQAIDNKRDGGTTVPLNRHSRESGNLMILAFKHTQGLKRYPVISGYLPCTLRAALRAFKFTPGKFVRGYDVYFISLWDFMFIDVVVHEITVIAARI